MGVCICELQWGKGRKPRRCQGHPRASPPTQALHVNTHGWEHFQPKSALLLSYFSPGAASAASAESYTSEAVSPLFPASSLPPGPLPANLNLPNQTPTPPHPTSRCPRWRLAGPGLRACAQRPGAGTGGGGGKRCPWCCAPDRPRLVCRKLRRPRGPRALSHEVMAPCSRDTEGIQARTASLYPSAHRREFPGQPLLRT